MALPPNQQQQPSIDPDVQRMMEQAPAPQPPTPADLDPDVQRMLEQEQAAGLAEPAQPQPQPTHRFPRASQVTEGPGLGVLERLGAGASARPVDTVAWLRQRGHQATLDDQGNVIYRHPESGELHRVNPRNLDWLDPVGAAPEILGALASIPGYIGGAIAGAPAGPVGAFAGGALAGGAAATAAEEGSKNIIRELMGVPESRTYAEAMGDVGRNLAWNVGAEAAGGAIGKGLQAAGRGIKNVVQGHRGSDIAQLGRQFDVDTTVSQRLEGGQPYGTLEALASQNIAAGPGAQRFREGQMDQLARARAGLAESMGATVEGRTAIGQFMQNALGEQRNAYRAESERLYDRAYDLLGREAPVQLNSVRELTADLLAAQQKAPESMTHLDRALRELGRINKDAAATGTLPLETLRSVRTRIGKDVGDLPAMGASADKVALVQVSDAIKADIDTLVRNSGPGPAAAYDDALSYTRDVVKPQEEFINRMLRQGQTAEAVANVILRSRPVATEVAQLRRNMTPDEWKSVVGSMIREMGRSTPGQIARGAPEFSAGSFATQVARLKENPEVWRALFSGTAMQEFGRTLDDLTRLSKSVASSDRYLNFSNTAQHAALYNLLGLGGGGAAGGLLAGSDASLQERLQYMAGGAAASMGLPWVFRNVTMRPGYTASLLEDNRFMRLFNRLQRTILRPTYKGTVGRAIDPAGRAINRRQLAAGRKAGAERAKFTGAMIAQFHALADRDPERAPAIREFVEGLQSINEDLLRQEGGFGAPMEPGEPPGGPPGAAAAGQLQPGGTPPGEVQAGRAPTAAESVERGWQRLMLSTGAVFGTDSDMYKEAESRLNQIPQDPAIQRAAAAANEADSYTGAIANAAKSIIDEPDTLSVLGRQFAEQLVNMATTAGIAGAVTRPLRRVARMKGAQRVARGVKAGARKTAGRTRVGRKIGERLEGKAVPIAATALGGLGGSLSQTYGSNLAEQLQQAGEHDQSAARRAITRSLAQGTVDALTAAIVPIKLGPNQFVNVPLQTLVQGAGGGAGEIAGAASIGETVSKGDVALEVLLEVVGLPGDVAGNVISTLVDTGKQQPPPGSRRPPSGGPPQTPPGRPPTAPGPGGPGGPGAAPVQPRPGEPGRPTTPAATEPPAATVPSEATPPAAPAAPTEPGAGPLTPGTGPVPAPAPVPGPGPTTPPAPAGAAAPTPQAGRAAVAVTPAGERVDVSFDLVEADSLTTSHDEQGKVNPSYPQALQPRDRAATTSQVQIQQMASNLHPELLGDSGSAEGGAPIVGGNVVESGNARTLAIRRAYKAGNADNYQNWLRDNAAQFGLNPAQVEQMRQPVLVRRRPTTMDEAERAAFTRDANLAGVQRMSPTEQARADVERITPEMLSRLDPNADLDSDQNAEFVRQFAAGLGTGEAAGFIDARGRATRQGIDRMRSALFQRAYQSDDLLALQAERNEESQNIIRALVDAAPAMAQLRDAGDTAAIDVVNQAVNQVRQARQRNVPIETQVGQRSMLEDEQTQAANDLALFMGNNVNAPARMGQALRRLGDRALAEARTQQQGGGLFGTEDEARINRLVTDAVSPRGPRYSVEEPPEPGARTTIRSNDLQGRQRRAIPITREEYEALAPLGIAFRYTRSPSDATGYEGWYIPEELATPWAKTVNYETGQRELMYDARQQQLMDEIANREPHLLGIEQGAPPEPGQASGVQEPGGMEPGVTDVDAPLLPGGQAAIPISRTEADSLKGLGVTFRYTVDPADMTGDQGWYMMADALSRIQDLDYASGTRQSRATDEQSRLIRKIHLEPRPRHRYARDALLHLQTARRPRGARYAVGEPGTPYPRDAGAEPVFHSPLLRSLDEDKPPAGAKKPGAWKSWLKKQQNDGKIKKAELDWLGINDWLDEQDKVSADQVRQFVAAHDIPLETRLWDAQPAPRPPFDEMVERLVNYEMTVNGAGARKVDRVDLGIQPIESRGNPVATALADGGAFVVYEVPREKMLELPPPAQRTFDTYQEALDYAENLYTASAFGGAIEAPNSNRFAVGTVDEMDGLAMDTTRRVLRNMSEDELAARLGLDNVDVPPHEGSMAPGGTNYRISFVRRPNPDNPFTRGHFGTDVIVHAILKDDVDDQGRAIIRAEEIQSDLHQRGRREGYDLSAGVERTPEVREAVAEWRQAQRAVEQTRRYHSDQLGFDIPPFEAGVSRPFGVLQAVDAQRWLRENRGRILAEIQDGDPRNMDLPPDEAAWRDAWLGWMGRSGKQLGHYASLRGRAQWFLYNERNLPGADERRTLDFDAGLRFVSKVAAGNPVQDLEYLDKILNINALEVPDAAMAFMASLKRYGYRPPIDRIGESMQTLQARGDQIAAAFMDLREFRYEASAAMSRLERVRREQSAKLGAGQVPDTPHKEEYPLLAIKQIMREAMDRGIDRITWATGDTISKRWGAMDERGNILDGRKVKSNRLWYDSKTRRQVEKYLRRFGGKVEKVHVNDGFGVGWAFDIPQAFKDQYGNRSQPSYARGGAEHGLSVYRSVDELAADLELPADDLAALRSQGRVRMVDTVAQLPVLDAPHPLDARGFTDDRPGYEGVVWLVAQNIPRGQARSVLLHEAVHADLRVNSRSAEWKNITNALKRGQAARNPEILRAFQNAEPSVAAWAASQDETRPGFAADMEEIRNEEALAYLVQHADPSNTLVRRILTWVKDILRRYGLGALAGDMTEQELLGLAERSLRRMAREAKARASYNATRGRGQTQPAYNRARRGELAARALVDIAYNDRELFRYPDSNASTVQGIVDDVDPRIQVTDQGMGGGYAEWVLMMPEDSREATIYAQQTRRNGPVEIWVNVADLAQGQSEGSKVYHIAATLAANNGATFIGDPSGLSDMGRFRRTENMLSSAIRQGSTRHLAPAQEQRDINVDAPAADQHIQGMRNLGWKEGDHAYNIAELMLTSAANTEVMVPQIRGMRYDLETGRILDSGGAEVTEIELQDHVKNQPGAPDRPLPAWARASMYGPGQRRTAKAGLSTVRRAILINTLVSGETGPDGAARLARYVQLMQGAKPGLPDSLRGSFYSTAELADPFYSRLAQAVGADDIERRPRAWRQHIKAQVNKGNISQAEVDWIGIDDYLDSLPQKSKVAPWELVEWIDNNGLQIQTVPLFGGLSNRARDNLIDDLAQDEAMRWDTNRIDDEASPDDGRWYIIDPNGDIQPGTYEYQIDAEEEITSQINHSLYRMSDRELVEKSGDTWRDPSPFGSAEYPVETLPGGRNYQEFLLNWKNAGDRYTGSHFDWLDDIVVHVRTTDRVMPDGRRVLFIEEIQSDWAQDVRNRERVAARGVFAALPMAMSFDIPDDALRQGGGNSGKTKIPTAEWLNEKIAAIPAEDMTSDLTNAIDRWRQAERRMNDPRRSYPDEAALAEQEITLGRRRLQLHDLLSEVERELQSRRPDRFPEFERRASIVSSGRPEFSPAAVRHLAIQLAAEDRFGIEFDDAHQAVEAFEFEGVDVDQALSESQVPFVQSALKYQGLRGQAADVSYKLERLKRSRSGSVEAHPVPQSRNWGMLAMKRMIRQAAENGYDRVAWTTGKQQSDRYTGSLEEGMSGYYDRILPNATNKFLKPFGTKVTRERIDDFTDEVMGFDLTPDMVTTARTKGFPLWAVGPGQAPLPGTFYSQLGAAIGNQGERSLKPRAWRQEVKGMLKRGEVKQAEVDWIGIDDWLDAQPKNDRITTNDLLQWVRDNQLDVRVVELYGTQHDEDNRGGLEEDYAHSWLQHYSVDEVTADNAEEFDGEAEEGQFVATDPNGELVYDYEGTPRAFDSAEEAERWILETLQEDARMMPFEDLADSMGRQDLLGTEPSPAGYSVYSDEAYREPGGDNYREFLVTMPQRAGSNQEPYIGPHWGDRENILVHIRVTDRIGKDGKRVLFIEEIQSDWAQNQRKYGAVTPEARDRAEQASHDYREAMKQYDIAVKDLHRKVDEAGLIYEAERRALGTVSAAEFTVVSEWARENGVERPTSYEEDYMQAGREGLPGNLVRQMPGGNRAKLQAYLRGQGSPLSVDEVVARSSSPVGLALQEANRLARQRVQAAQASQLANDELSGQVNRPHPQPQSRDWTMLAVKRMVREAAENGYDRIAWTTGAMQDDRYGNFERELVEQADDLRLSTVSNSEGRIERAVLEVRPPGNRGFRQVAQTIRPPSDAAVKVWLETLIGSSAANALLAQDEQKGSAGDNLRYDGLASMRTIPTADIEIKPKASAFESYYDKIVPNAINKFLRPWKTKVNRESLQQVGETQGFDVTDDMKQTATTRGFPTWSRGPRYARGPEQFLTPAERKMNAPTMRRFVEHFHRMPPTWDYAAGAAAGSEARGWYEATAQFLHEALGPVDSIRMAGLIAATSPQTSVEMNVINALRIWNAWEKAGRPRDRRSVMRIMAENVVGERGDKSVLDAWRNNTWRALAAPEGQVITLSGPKVDSFQRNLMGVMDEVTNDVWMAAFAAFDQELLGGQLSKSGLNPGKGSGYKAMNARTRQAARLLTRITGEKWTPAEVQETVWSWARALTLSRRGGGRDIRRQTLPPGVLARDNPTIPGIMTSPQGGPLLRETINEASIQRAADAARDVRSTRTAGNPAADALRDIGSQVSPTGRQNLERSLGRSQARLETQFRESRARADEGQTVGLATARLMRDYLDPGTSPSSRQRIRRRLDEGGLIGASGEPLLEHRRLVDEYNYPLLTPERRDDVTRRLRGLGLIDTAGAPLIEPAGMRIRQKPPSDEALARAYRDPNIEPERKQAIWDELDRRGLIGLDLEPDDTLFSP